MFKLSKAESWKLPPQWFYWYSNEGQKRHPGLSKAIGVAAFNFQLWITWTSFATAHKRSNKEFVAHIEDWIFKKYVNSDYSACFTLKDNFYAGQASVVFNGK